MLVGNRTERILTAQCVVRPSQVTSSLRGREADVLVNITTLCQGINIHKSILMQGVSDSCCQHSRSKHPPRTGGFSDALILDVQNVQSYDLMEMMQIITLPSSISL